MGYSAANSRGSKFVSNEQTKFKKSCPEKPSAGVL